MANLYSAGYGEDGPAAYNQQMTTAADQAQSQVPAGVSPYAQQAQRAQRRQNQPWGQQWGQQRRRMGGVGQPTFRQMQASGQARPAPPPPETWRSGGDAPMDGMQAMSAPQSVQPAQQVQQMQQVQQPRPVLQQQGTAAPDNTMYKNWLSSMQGSVDPRQAEAFQAQSSMLQQASATRTPETDALMRQAQSMGLDPMAVMQNPQGFQQYLSQMAGVQQPMTQFSQGAAPPDMAVAASTPLSGGNTFAQMAMDLQRQTQAAQGFDTAPATLSAPTMSAPTPMAEPAPMVSPTAALSAPALASGVGTAPQFTGDIRDYIGQALNNPGGYSFDETKKLYERAGQEIDDQFASREQALREEMAARGLSDSSIYGGRAQDLNVGRRQARQDLLQNLGSQQAQALFGQQTGFLDRLLGLRSQDQTAGYQAGQLGLQQGQLDLGRAELNRGLMNDQDRMMLALLGLGDF